MTTRSLAIVLVVMFRGPVFAAPPRVASDTRAPAAKPDVLTQLHRYYGTRAGYAKVTRDVMTWHKTALNGCVAFASTALRHVGVAIPKDGDDNNTKDTQNVSRITRAFSRYLVEDLAWVRVEDPAQLRPGDVVFTTDASCCPGYPAHVMMFDGWARRDHKTGLFVDNQGFHVERAIAHTEGSDVDGFAYALRPPPEPSAE